MSSQAVDHSEHPVVDFAHRLHDRLSTLAEMPLLSMTPEQKRDALVSLTQDVAQLEVLRLRVLARGRAVRSHRRLRCPQCC